MSADRKRRRTNIDSNDILKLVVGTTPPLGPDGRAVKDEHRLGPHTLRDYDWQWPFIPPGIQARTGAVSYIYCPKHSV